jgi:hypothetical protein
MQKLQRYALPEGISYHKHNGFVACYASFTGSNVEEAAKNAILILRGNPNVPVNVANLYPKYAKFASQEAVKEFLEEKVNEGCLNGFTYKVYIEETCYYLIRLDSFESDQLKELAADENKWHKALRTNN